MFTYVDGLLKYKDASGQWHEADVIKGESAYQAAVRLGIFSGTESEYYNKITNDRDSALSQINAKLTEVLSAIDTKKQETLADIPSDYTALSSDVSDLKSAIDGMTIITDTLSDTTGEIGYSRRINTVGRYSPRNAENQYYALVLNIEAKKGSTITPKAGYLMDYSAWSIRLVNSTEAPAYRYAFKQNIQSGEIITINQDCYLNVSVTKETNPEVMDSVEKASALFDAGVDFSIVLGNKADAALNEINDLPYKKMIDSPFYHGKLLALQSDFSEFYIPTISDFTEPLNSTTQYSRVIELFDGLVALDQGFIVKTDLGASSDANLHLYEYTINPHNYSAEGLDTYLDGKPPLILCDAGIHGFEKNSVYELYYFLKDLLTNYRSNPILNAIRSNVCLKVIPVSNPYGFNADQYYNKNNVNINRNFATSGWQKVTDSDTGNTGDAPFDQPESVIIRDWINANKQNLFMYLNLHTNGRYYASGYNNANSCMPKFERTNGDGYFYRLANVVSRHIERQTINLPLTFNTLTPSSTEYIGRYQRETSSEGTATIWAAENGVLSMTFETFNGLSVGVAHVIELFTADSKKCCTTILGNIIASAIAEYA